MNIVVCIKQVPDTGEVKLDKKTNTLIREGVPSIINPDDKAGLELALRIKGESSEKVKITALSMGPLQAKTALREALAMGCDEAIIVTDRAFGGSDTLATSTILAAALKKIPFDLIITGRQAIDGDTAQVGPQIAQHLGIPQITYVSELNYLHGESVVEAVREFEDINYLVRTKAPCLVTILSERIRARYMTVQGISDAFQKKIVQFNYETLKDVLPEDRIGLKGSPTKVIKTFVKQARGEGIVFTNISDKEGAKKIKALLDEKHVI